MLYQLSYIRLSSCVWGAMKNRPGPAWLPVGRFGMVTMDSRSHDGLRRPVSRQILFAAVRRDGLREDGRLRQGAGSAVQPSRLLCRHEPHRVHLFSVKILWAFAVSVPQLVPVLQQLSFGGPGPRGMRAGTVSGSQGGSPGGALRYLLCVRGRIADPSV